MNWQQINRARVKHIRRGELIFLRMFAKARKELKQQLERVETTNEILQVVESFQTDVDIQAAYERVYTTTGVAFAKMQKAELKRAAGKLETKQNDWDDESVWFTQMMEYVRTKCGNRISETTRTLYADIQNAARRSVQMGANEGWGARKVADDIIARQGEIEKWKALRIARTETMAASNAGAMQGASDTGIPNYKIWISSNDGRTRGSNPGDEFDHITMNGVEVLEHEYFEVNGDKLMHPGDPNGQPGNVINCRCAVGFRPVRDVVGEYLGEVEPEGEPQEELMEKTVMEKERRIKDYQNEVGVAYDENGNVLFEKMGTEDKIGFTMDEVKQMKNNILTHNHPDGSSFSIADLNLCVNHELKEIRAVSSQRNGVYKFSINRTAFEKSGMTRAELFQKIVESEKNMWIPDYPEMKKYLTSIGIKPTKELAHMHWWDYFNANMLKGLPVDYSFKPF